MAVRSRQRSKWREISALGARASVALLLLGCAGPSRYVIIQIPPRPASVPPTGQWPPRDDDLVVPTAWCDVACAPHAKEAERARECRMVDLSQYALGIMYGVVCEFE